MFKLNGIKVAAICSVVPQNIVRIEDVAGFVPSEIEKVIDTIGFVSFHVADDDMTTSDYCVAAAQKLMNQLGIAPDSIDAIIFVSQTPDYVMPSTSITMQPRLGLREDVLAFDINQGCPGFIYGIFQAGSLINAGLRRVLLCVGDTASKMINPMDRSARAFFGDAAAAVLIEPGEHEFSFSFFADGSQYDALMIPAGGMRKRASSETMIPYKDENGNVRSECQIHMKGAELTTFYLKNVAALLKEFLAELRVSPSSVDLFALHQVNKLILNAITRKLGVLPEKVPFGASEYGCTSSASLPLLLSTKYSINETTASDLGKVILCSFGVGLSVVSAYVSLQDTLIMRREEI